MSNESKREGKRERENCVYLSVCVREREREKEYVCLRALTLRSELDLNPASTPVTLGRLFKLSESQFTHLKNKSND